MKNISYNNIIQTNGLLLDDEWMRLLKKYNVSLGVSIDGSDFESNLQRFSNKIQFNKLIENLYKLKKLEYNPALFFTITNLNKNKINDIFNFIEKYRPYSYMFNPIISNDNFISSEEWQSILLKMRIFSEKTGIENAMTYHINRGINGKILEMCLFNGMCQKFISLDNSGDIFASCVEHSSNYCISNISDDDFGQKIIKYTDTPFTIKKDSIYNILFKNNKYKYFQGNGCVKCRNTENNEEFITGIVNYIKEITDDDYKNKLNM